MRRETIPPRRIVWARESVAVDSCPTSYITAQSLGLLDKFYAWKVFGEAACRDLSARTAEAFCILEREVRLERLRAEK